VNASFKMAQLMRNGEPVPTWRVMLSLTNNE
jgi:hypothetical protein